MICKFNWQFMIKFNEHLVFLSSHEKKKKNLRGWDSLFPILLVVLALEGHCYWILCLNPITFFFCHTIHGSIFSTWSCLMTKVAWKNLFGLMKVTHEPLFSLFPINFAWKLIKTAFFEFYSDEVLHKAYR